MPPKIGINIFNPGTDTASGETIIEALCGLANIAGLNASTTDCVWFPYIK